MGVPLKLRCEGARLSACNIWQKTQQMPVVDIAEVYGCFLRLLREDCVLLMHEFVTSSR